MRHFPRCLALLVDNVELHKGINYMEDEVDFLKAQLDIVSDQRTIGRIAMKQQILAMD
jgi:hypothetical protein